MAEVVSPGQDDRRGLKWTTDEEKKLINELAENKTFDEIAVSHGRTSNGIEMHISDMAARWKKNGMADDEIIRILRLSKEQLDEAIKTRQRKLESTLIRSNSLDSTNNINLQLTEINRKLDILLGVFTRVQVTVPEVKKD